MVDTLRPRQNGRHFADDNFKCIFLNENAWISLVPEVRSNNIPALVQIMAWRRRGDKPLSEPMMLVYRRIYASLGLNELKVSHGRANSICSSVQHIENRESSLWQFWRHSPDAVKTLVPDVTTSDAKAGIITHIGFQCSIWIVPLLYMCKWSLVIFTLTGFPSQFKFDGNFDSLSRRFWYSDRYKLLYMARQLCCAVVACAKICCDLMAGNGITARQSFHRIWISGKKSVLKRASGQLFKYPTILLSSPRLISTFFLCDMAKCFLLFLFPRHCKYTLVNYHFHTAAM